MEDRNKISFIIYWYVKIILHVAALAFQMCLIFSF